WRCVAEEDERERGAGREGERRRRRDAEQEPRAPADARAAQDVVPVPRHVDAGPGAESCVGVVHRATSSKLVRRALCAACRVAATVPGATPRTPAIVP